MDRENRIRQVAEYVRSQSEEVSVKDIAEALDLSKSYVRQLAREAREEGLIEGQKSKPVIGYIFEERGRARADGGERNGELRVLTTREALLQAVRDFAPDRYSEAVGKDLQELRKFVRNEVADGTVPVAHAWRFSA
jgi:DNA-binding transcriptional ArsR family regulator